MQAMAASVASARPRCSLEVNTPYADPFQNTEQPPAATNDWLATLLDLPDSLLARLVAKHMDSDSQGELFKVCRMLRNLVLKHCNRTELTLDLFNTPLSDALKPLRLASAHASNVYLRLCWGEPYGYRGHTKSQRLRGFSQNCLAVLQAAHAVGALATVNGLELMGADVDVLLQPDNMHLFAHLRTLQLDHATITDDGMEQLLHMPNLTQLGLGCFKLQRSYAGHPCKWQTIMCSSMSVVTLTQLPLHAQLQLKVQRYGPDDQDGGPLSLQIPPGTTCSTCMQALANVAECKGILWDDNVNFGFDCDEGGGAELGQLLVLSLPLLVDAPGLSLHNVQLTSDMMLALGEHMKSKKWLFLTGSCDWEEDVGVWLVACMLEDSEFWVYIESEEQLTRLCCAARQRLKLFPHVSEDLQLPDGCLDRIKAAMQLCGHQHATIPYFTVV